MPSLQIIFFDAFIDVLEKMIAVSAGDTC